MPAMHHLGSNKFTLIHVETLQALSHNFTDAFVYSWMHFRVSDKNTNVIEQDGELWWSVTPGEIAEEIGGASVDVVRRSLDRLIAGGWLLVCEHQLRGLWDRRRSYRVTQPSGKYATGAVANLPNLPISTKEVSKPKKNEYSEEFNLWWKTFPKAPDRTPPSKALAWQRYREALKETTDAVLMDQLQAYIPTVDKPRYFKNPNLWLSERFWELDFPKVVNPLDEAVAAGDADTVERLTGMRFREPVELAGLPLVERHAARREAFGGWVSENRDRLVAGWRSKTSD